MAKVPIKVAEVKRYKNVLEDFPTRQTYTPTELNRKISSEVLVERFGIGIEHARTTLGATVKRVTRSAILPISRRYMADRQHTVKRFNGKFTMNTIW